MVLYVYFNDEDHFPDVESFEKLWSALGVFREKTVVGAFWQHGNPALSVESSRCRRMRLGDLAVFQISGLNRRLPVFGGGVHTKKTAAIPHRDSDFNVTMAEASRGVEGPSLPSFMLGISDQWMKLISETAMLELLQRIFSILDQFKPRYGFIDFASADSAYIGLAYSPMITGNAPLNRYVEEATWAHHVSEGNLRVRSIYWGNYFNRQILNKLSENSCVVSEYRNATRSNDGSKHAHIWEFQNGAFFSLSRSLEDVRPGNAMTLVQHQMLWLHKYLFAAGLI
ncbi:MAG: hypothetical protein R3C17_11650 [Planctomycetaceae bacterium]